MIESHEAYRLYLETLKPATLKYLCEYVSVDVHFRDPLNDVCGVEAMQRVLSHMFDELGPVHFKVTEAASVGDVCLMRWQFTADSQRRHWKFDGMSVVRFCDDGRVKEHIDYWDSSAVIFSKVPILRWILSYLRRSISAH